MVKGNAELRRYMRKVRSWIPGSGKLKKGILDQIEATVHEYLTENPGADYTSLLKRFGTPQQIASAYVDAMDTAELLRNLKIRRNVLRIVATVAAAIIIIWAGAVSVALVSDYNSANGRVYISGAVEDHMP